MTPQQTDDLVGALGHVPRLLTGFLSGTLLAAVHVALGVVPALVRSIAEAVRSGDLDALRARPLADYLPPTGEIIREVQVAERAEAERLARS